MTKSHPNDRRNTQKLLAMKKTQKTSEYQRKPLWDRLEMAIPQGFFLFRVLF